jgi:beta-glucosidase
LAVKVVDGFINQVGSFVEIYYAKGSNILDDPEYAKKVNVFGPKVMIDKRSPKEMLDEAIKISGKADVVIAVIGEASEMSGESASRTNLLIPEAQKELVRALAKTGKPLVLVVMSGRPLALTEELELADAVLFTGHPGVEAGNAIAEVIYGDYNPSGKVTATFPRNVGQVPIYHSIRKTGRPQNGDEFEKFKTNYLDVENSPLIPFGFGLSYTNFEYSDFKLNTTEMSPETEITATVTLKNTGNFDGEEVVQLYLRDLVASTTRPLKELKGFQKVYLKKGETKQLSFTITEELLKFYGSDLVFDSEQGEFEVFTGGNSVDVLTQKFNLKK